MGRTGVYKDNPRGVFFRRFLEKGFGLPVNCKNIGKLDSRCRFLGVADEHPFIHQVVSRNPLI